MSITGKNSLVQEIIKKLKSFVRPIIYNGSSATAQDENRLNIYESIYSKSKSNEMKWTELHSKS